MKIIQPSRETFWRTVLLTSAALPFLSIWQSIMLARTLEVDILARISWIGLIAGLFILGLIPLLTWTLTWSRYREHILALIESPERAISQFRWVGWALLPISILGYTILFTLLPVRNLFGNEEWLRLLVFWYFSLVGLFALRICRGEMPRFSVLAAVILFQTTFHLLIAQFSSVTDYPFAMGWSETSRYYYPSLFLSQYVYGHQYPWPILHPTLHLLLAPPYLIHAPLWAHRLWQVLMRLIWVGAIVPAMMRRFSIQGKGTRWLVAIWMFLYLFMGPLYFHLAIPVILILIGFSLHNDRRNWFVILLASAWCGWSRVNWYPMPAILAAVLYVLETPFKGKNLWQYLWKPALWGIFGTLTAFLFQRLYIVVSGVENSRYFYTSFTSNLLWYRLLPNATYPPGILPAVILSSLAMWIMIWLLRPKHKEDFHPLRGMLILSALGILFAGGILVCLKIGGGADLHNMDAYFILLLIVFSYLVSAKYEREDGKLVQPVPLQWLPVALLLVTLIWSHAQANAGFITYDRQRTNAVLTSLQQYVDQVNAGDGEVLFITQRHLISMDMLRSVNLVAEYEREDLMEMAMANNVEYLEKFRNDIKNKRFALIIVDPLRFVKISNSRSFAEENNVWAARVAKVILCNYREEVAFPSDNITLYVPQTGESKCPK